MTISGPQPSMDDAQRAALAAGGALPGGAAADAPFHPAPPAAARQRHHATGADPAASGNLVPGGAAHVVTTQVIDPAKAAQTGQPATVVKLPSLATRAPDLPELPDLSDMPRPEVRPLPPDALAHLYGLTTCKPTPMVSDAMVAAVIVEASSDLQTDYRQAKWGYYAQQYSTALASADKLRDEADDTLTASKIKGGLAIGFACLAAGFTGAALYKSMKGVGSAAEKEAGLNKMEQKSEVLDDKLNDSVLEPDMRRSSVAESDFFESQRDISRESIRSNSTFSSFSSNRTSRNISDTSSVGSNRTRWGSFAEEAEESEHSFSGSEVSDGASQGSRTRTGSTSAAGEKPTGLERLDSKQERELTAKVTGMSGLAQVMNSLAGSAGDLASAWKTHDAQMDHAASATLDAAASLRREEAEQASSSEDIQVTLNRSAIDVVRSIFESEVAVIENSMRAL